MAKFLIVLSLVLTVAACASEHSPSMGPDSTPGSNEDGGGFIKDGTVNLLPPDRDGSVSESDAGQDAEVTQDASQDAEIVGDAGQDAEVDGQVGGNDASTDSGSDAEVGNDATTPDPECPGSGPGTKCEGLKRFACVEGQWAEQETCDHVCQAGECIGVCDPEDKDCSGDFPRECNENGQWVAGLECSFVCSAGNCIGACVPGDRDCTGLIPRECNDQGQWVAEPACPFICGGEGVCSGGCTPTDRDCSGDVPRHCNSAGQWIAEPACPFICGGEGVCSGSCEPTATSCTGDIPRTCNAAGSWVNGTACPFVCSAGSCTGVCEPGDRDCSGTTPRECNAQGQWVAEPACPYLCGGEGVCSGSCTPTATSCSGDVPQSCNAQGQWVNGTACPFVCSAGACTGVCEPGDTRCSDAQIQTCGSNGQWQAPANCGAVAGATTYCSAGACTFDCDLDYDDCDNNPANGCEVDLNNDSDNCGQCGHSCCGGACGEGTCNVYDTGAAGSSYAVDQNNLYTAYGTTLSKQPRTDDTSTTVVALTSTAAGAAITNIASDGTTIYWTHSNAGIFSVAANGTGTSSVTYLNASGTNTLTSNHGAITTFDWTSTGTMLAYDATRLYWYTGGSVVSWKDRTMANPQSQSPGAVTIANTPTTSFVVDDTNLYAVSTARRAMTRSVVASDTTTDWVTSASSNYSFGRLSTDKTNVYYPFFNAVTTTEQGIWKKPVAGGAAVQLVQDTAVGVHTTTDGSFVYYTKAVSATVQIRKVPVNGGASQLVTTRSTTPTNFKTVGQCLYWQEGLAIKASAVAP